jgi:hypothetical protein
MDDLYEHDNGLRALAMRVAALEDNVAFLEEWCEEQQDVLDRTAGPVGYDYEIEAEPEPAPRAILRVDDLRDEVLAVLEAAVDDVDALTEDDELGDEPLGATTITALVETEHERRVRLIRTRLDRLRVRLRAQS